MPLTDQQKQELVRAHEPVMWLHEREAFHPVHCGVAAELSELFSDAGRVNANPRLEDLAGLDDEHYLKLRHLDMERLTAGLSPDVKFGPAALADYARENYGHDLRGSGFPASRPATYFARVVEDVTLRRPRPEARSNYPDGHPVEGDYVAIEYHFYFVYNDFWNHHQGDWDATTVVLLRAEDEISGEGYVVTFTHGFAWACRYEENSTSFAQWLGTWQRTRPSRLQGAFVLDGHPFVFVNQGGHGGYPTPGTICLGVSEKILWLDRVRAIITTDVRQVGKVCILPPGLEQAVSTVLLDSGIPTAGLQSTTWDPPELLDRGQSWLTYEGRWGQPSPFAGWDGPASAMVKDGADPRRALLNALKTGYRAKDPTKVLFDRHHI